MDADLMRPARLRERLHYRHVVCGIVELELKGCLGVFGLAFELDWHFAFRLAAHACLNI